MNTKVTTIIFLLLIAFFTSQAQTFTEITDQNFVDVNTNGVVWFDFDNDNDLDLLMVGEEADGEYSMGFYKNNADGTFSLSDAINNDLFSPFCKGDATVADYNNDGFLDVFLGGYGSGDDYPGDGLGNFLLKNNGNNTFEIIDTDIIPLWYANFRFADLDNDGDHDIFITGTTGTPVRTTAIFLNNNEVFEELDNSITDIWVSESNIADYDNDGDNDIFLAGFTQDMTRIANVWENQPDNTFFDTQQNFTGIIYGGILPFDYNADGYDDVIIKGKAADGEHCKIHSNNGDGSFDETDIEITPYRTNPATVADFDNDGYLDLIVSGQTGENEWGDGEIKIYRNTQTSNFEEITGLNLFQMDGVAKPADYDNDGDLDFIFNGTHNSSEYDYISYTKFYKNDIETPNNIPTAPTNLQMTLSDGELTLSWDAATDTETPQDGLTYNIFVGTTENGIDIVSPLADIETGYRRVVDFGNAGHNTSWIIKNVSAENIYWGIQAIDNNFAGSEFAKKNNVTNIANAEKNIISIFPNPSNGTFSISNYGLQITKIEITDITGKIVHKSEFVIRNSQFQIYKKGIYFIKIQTDNQIFTEKIIIQ